MASIIKYPLHPDLALFSYNHCGGIESHHHQVEEQLFPYNHLVLELICTTLIICQQRNTRTTLCTTVDLFSNCVLNYCLIFSPYSLFIVLWHLYVMFVFVCGQSLYTCNSAAGKIFILPVAHYMDEHDNKLNLTCPL